MHKGKRLAVTARIARVVISGEMAQVAVRVRSHPWGRADAGG